MTKFKALALAWLMVLSAATLGVTAASGVAVADDRTGDADGGTLATPDAIHEITDCTTIDRPGVYRVTADLTAPADAEACIEVTTGDVVIEGNGHTIDGTSGYDAEKRSTHHGVWVHDAGGDDHGAVAPDAHGPPTLSNVTVRNLRVTEWTHGVDLSNVANGAVEDVTAERNRVGVVFHGNLDSVATAVTVRDSAMHGVRIKGRSDGVAVVDTSVTDNGKTGVKVTTSNRTTVRESVLTNNPRGIDVHNSVAPTVRENVLVGNAEGVVFTKVAEGTVSNNDVSGGGTGVFLSPTRQKGGHDGHATAVLPNADDGHGGSHTAGDNLVTDNRISDTEVGISLRGSGHGGGHDDGGHDDGTHAVAPTDEGGHDAPNPDRIADNVLRNNGVGILVQSATGNEIVSNVVLDSTGWAYRSVDGATDNEVANLMLGDDSPLALSFTAKDVAVRGAESVPATPDGRDAVGTFFEATGTAADSWLDVEVGYDPASVSPLPDELTASERGTTDATSAARSRALSSPSPPDPPVTGPVVPSPAERSLRLWQHDGTAWSVVGATDTYHFVFPPNDWVNTDATGVSIDRNVVYAHVEDLDGVTAFAPLTGSLDPGIDVRDPSLSDASVGVGDAVTATATVANEGSDPVTVRADLKVDGTVVESTEVDVPAGGSAPVTFTRTFDAAGAYLVGISDTYVGTVDVAAPDGSSLSSPAVDTRPAAGVTDGTATLVGEITGLDGADSAQVAFQVWRAGDWNSRQWVQAGTVSSPGQFTADVSGLDPGTEYTYFAWVKPADGSTFTGDQAFFATTPSTVTDDGGTGVPPATDEVQRSPRNESARDDQAGSHRDR